MEIKELIEQSHQIAKEHGWWDDDRPIREAILMTIVELCEAIQKDRSDDYDGLIEEIVDVWIRLADLTACFDLHHIENRIKIKMEINKNRSWKHDKKY